MKAAVPPESPLNRRRFLQLAALTAAAGLSGCSRGNAVPTLRAAADTLPALWRRRLPQALDSCLPSAMPLRSGMPGRHPPIFWRSRWLAVRSSAITAPGDRPALRARLGPLGKRFLADTPETWSGLLLPVGFSPWVMLIRREMPSPAPVRMMVGTFFWTRRLRASCCFHPVQGCWLPWRIGSTALTRCGVCVPLPSALTIALR